MSFMADLIRQKQNFKWRKRNRHNGTKIEFASNLNLIDVGNYSYGGLYVVNVGKKYKLKIGHFCSIAPGVKFIVQGDHPIDHISTFPFHAKCLGDGKIDAVSKGDIIVGDDVWIGSSAMVLSGVTIGQGAIIAAGAVITKDVEPYAIIGGIPGSLLKYRFKDELRSELIKVDYSKVTREMVALHLHELYAPLNSLKQIDWMPRWSEK